MKRLALLVAVLVCTLGIAYLGDRAYRRSLPPLPAVVPAHADLAQLLDEPLAARLRRAVLGNAADPRAVGPRLIALTFDDGPYPVDTPLLLAALRNLRVPATFFLIGRDAEQEPGLVRAIAAAGDEIGDHTETHPDLDLLEDGAVSNELRAGTTTLGRIVPQASEGQLFRPPHGRFRPATLRVAQRDGYTTVLWTDDPGDWRPVSAAEIAAHVASRATSPEILLLHSGRPETVAMLPDAVARFRRAGYTFVTVSELLRRVSAEQLNRAARTPLPQ